MWRIILSLFAAAITVVAAEPFRVTTWNLEWFPSGHPNAAKPEIEAANIAAAAKKISEINPDVLVLQEVRDWETCERIAAAVVPVRLQVLVCSAFRDGFSGGIGRQQVAILAKRSAIGAWAETWKTKGLIDPPRGLAVAVIEIGKHQIAVYSVHLKSNLVRDGSERTKQLNILKRELSADQLVNHAALLKRDYPSLDGVVIAGDFNTNADQDLFISERTLGVFEQRGFTNTWAGIPLIERITHPGKGQYPNATFDYVFAKGIRSVGSPQIVSAPFSDHRAVTAIFDMSAL